MNIKFGSVEQRADQEAKTSGNTNSFRMKMQRKNRHFRECSKWVEENLQKVAKMFELQGRGTRRRDSQSV